MVQCAICGTNEATTKDHVPPKGIFPKPRPNMITVPACGSCNNGASELDDLFKVYLSMQAAEINEIANRLFSEKTVRTLKQNQRLLREIKEEAKDIQVEQADGSFKTRTGVLWNSEAHDKVIERTIRGLYYYHSGNPIPKNTVLKVQWLKQVPKQVEDQIELLSVGVIGDNQVTYKYVIAAEDLRYSTWVFDFYGAHYASGYTQPI